MAREKGSGMTGIDWEAAAGHWAESEPDKGRMPEEELIANVDEFLARHKVCALACAGAGIVRNTPVEYLHAEDAFWIFSEGGLKFRALRENRNVCLAIFDDNPSFDSLAGLQVTGHAEALEPFGDEYAHACELKGIPIERLEKFPFTMNIIKITPVRYDYLDSSLKERGYSPRQHADLGTMADALVFNPASGIPECDRNGSSQKALATWDAMGDKEKRILLNNAWCHRCNDGSASFAAGYTLHADEFGVVIEGKCAKCGESIARCSY